MRLPNIVVPVIRQTKNKIDISSRAALSNIQPQGPDEAGKVLAKNPATVGKCLTYAALGSGACLLAMSKGRFQGFSSRQCRDNMINAGGECAKLVDDFVKAMKK